MNDQQSNGFSCPAPLTKFDTIQTAHGAGGRMMAELIDSIFIKTFSNAVLDQMEDQAELNIPAERLVFTTDSYVVDPIFFPGGNIGDLAVNGTVNDLCMSGAKPLYLSAGFILEEGLPIADLMQIVASMKIAADKSGVQIVTGDTKVVNKGSCDKIFINTSGIGIIEKNLKISASNLQPGDVVIISGTIADHGMSVLTSREGLSFENQIKSDSAALNSLVESMTSCTTEIHAMRDPTRGGVAATLNEFAKQSNVGIELDAGNIPIQDDVNAACELLGIDALTVANEGKLIAIVAESVSNTLIQEMRKHPLGENAQIIGRITDRHPGMVVQKTILGVEHIVEMPLGEQLPRIC